MKKPLDWKPSFDTGHPVIDEQHRGLVECLHGITVCMGGKKALEQCREFRSLMKQHFADEEDILTQADFPRQAAHRLSHRESLMRYDAIYSDCDEVCTESADDSCTEELTFLLFDHFLRSDLDFKSYLQTRNQGSASSDRPSKT
jgi:hemerythrin-like metal-binding protein